MFLCSSCQYGSPIKLGKCPSCGDFGTFEKEQEEIVLRSPKTKKSTPEGRSLSTHATLDRQRRPLSHKEFQRVIGTCVKQGWVYLLAGEPGIGKSTIVLQLLGDLVTMSPALRCAYFSGEEDGSQITERWTRLAQPAQWSPDIYHTTLLEDMSATLEQSAYDIIVVDSIQTIATATVDSGAWSINQVKTCTQALADLAKKLGVTIIIIGHVTKDGEIAGPKYLEHIVDVVLYLEWDRYGQYRFLRTRKNRFGTTDETGIFEMTLFGLQPVYDLKERILWGKLAIAGHVLSVAIDNGRPLVITLEALLNKSVGKYPQRVAIGIENNRLTLLVAILEKYLKLKLGAVDIFINIPGEFVFRDSGLDLAVAAAIYSQYKGKVIPNDMIFLGEIGLGGQILPTKLHTKRCNEARELNIIDHTKIKYINQLLEWM